MRRIESHAEVGSKSKTRDKVTMGDARTIQERQSTGGRKIYPPRRHTPTSRSIGFVGR